MNFTSPEFLLCFPLVIWLYWAMPHHRRWMLLLAVSYLFYMNGSLKMGLLLFSVTLVSWWAAGRIAAAKDFQIKRRWVTAAAAYALVMLAVFKGQHFLVAGISFYTFQTLSYVLDVYCGEEEERKFGMYALFVSFFPQLVAGPIERGRDLLPQLKKEMEFRADYLLDGGWLLVRGFYKKLAVADYLAGFVDCVYEAPAQAGGLGAVLGTVLFAVQIYCDFSGYTDIARGAAKMLGINLMENFRHPYGAENIRQFWRRWHISLTRWFTVYLYIPLGGNRRGSLRHCRNILLVFGLSGLWHGLSWNYLVWGLLHGIFLTGYVFWEKLSVQAKAAVCSGRDRSCVGEGRLRVRKVLSCGGTFGMVCFAWIFFRAENLMDAGILLKQIFCPPYHFPLRDTLYFLEMGRIDVLRLPLVLFCLWMAERLPEGTRMIKDVERASKAALLTFFMITVVFLSWLSNLSVGGNNAFIYFRF